MNTQCLSWSARTVIEQFTRPGWTVCVGGSILEQWVCWVQLMIDGHGNGDDNGSRVTRLPSDVDIAVISFPTALASHLKQLTDAERQVSEYILMGLSNEAIAQKRDVSVRTVANQIAAIFRKLGVASRHELVASVVGKQTSAKNNRDE